MKEWQNAEIGCFVCSYDAFKSIHGWKPKEENAETPKKKKQKRPDPIELQHWMKGSKEILLNCANIVVCDEGHALKNSATVLNQSVSEIKTKKRIILSGTPIQNNLIECECLLFHELVSFRVYTFYFIIFPRLQYDPIHQKWISWFDSVFYAAFCDTNSKWFEAISG